MEQRRQGLEVPEWMLEPVEKEDNSSGDIRTGFIGKTLAGISRSLQEDLLSERFSMRSGFLQNIDARIKLVSILFFMLYAGFTSRLAALLVLTVVAFLLAKLSQLEITRYVKRVWLILPVIMLVLSIPAATSLIIKGRPILFLYRNMDFAVGSLKMPKEVYFSIEGLISVLKMAVRLGVSFSYGYLLVMTTRWSNITKALKSLRVPITIVAILDMTYRYIFILARLAEEMFEARFLRTVGRIKNKENRRFISSSSAFLFIKASYMSEELYEAMMCRGYSGNPVSLGGLKLTGSDFLWLLNVGIILFVLSMI